MTNHVHLILTPHNDEALAKAIGRTHFIYTQYINRLHQRSGHLWQNRFYSCPLDNRHFLEAMRYIECNPVRAGIVRKPWRYPFSSAAAHIGEPDATGLLNMRHWQKQTKTIDWRQCLLKRLPKENLNRIRRQTHTGRPLATDSLLSKLENTQPTPPPTPRRQTQNRIGLIGDCPFISKLRQLYFSIPCIMCKLGFEKRIAIKTVCNIL